jgi:hypothetical protein
VNHDSGATRKTNKVLQQLPEPRHCLPLHLLQLSSGKLLPLLLHLRLPALLNLLLMLPLRLSKGIKRAHQLVINGRILLLGRIVWRNQAPPSILLARVRFLLGSLSVG